MDSPRGPCSGAETPPIIQPEAVSATKPQGNNGMRGRTFKRTIFAGFVALVPLLDRISAHELDDIFVRPNVSRYALTQAFLRGGEAERTALEAELASIPGADDRAVQLGRDLDGDGDPDEIHFHLEVIDVPEEVY